MKTIATAAILAILSVPAFAADNKTGQTTDTQKPRTPIVLSATQLDGVTAGESGSEWFLDINTDLSGSTTNSRRTFWAYSYTSYNQSQ